MNRLVGLVAMLGVIDAASAFAGPFPSAYEVACSTAPGLPPISFVAKEITSVLGEPRPSSQTGLRFHQGTDIGDCGPQFSVGAIEGGVVELPPTSACVNPATGGPGTNCLRIVNQATNHAFDYIHISYDPSIVGTTVVAGALIGSIQKGETHLHLNDVNLGATVFDQNAQRGNGLQFVDNGMPQFFPASGGSFALPALAPLASYAGGEDGANPSPTPFQTASDGSYIVPGNVPSFDFLATVNDPINGLRRGVYSLQLTVAPVNAPFNFIYNGFSGVPNISFDSILDSDPNLQVHTIYLQQNPGSNTAFITNSKINFTSGEEAADNNDVQSANFAEGEYEACATAVGFPNAPFANIAQTCTNLIIDRMPPGLTAYDSSGLQIATGTYTKTLSISVQVDDALSGPGGVELDDNGVFVASTSASFPPPSYAYTSSNLPVLGNIPEGNVQITGYDQAGNATATNFIVDHTPPESAILSPQNYSVMPATAMPGFVISGTAEDPVSGGVASGIDHVNLYIQVPGGWWNGSTTVGSPVAVTAQGTNNWSYVMTMGVPASPLFRRKPESDRAQARKCRFQIPKENGQTSTRNVFYQFFT